MSKPDGLFVVQKGEEEQFMRSLPLSKLWGAGKKTQDKLLAAGFITTDDIYNAAIESLTSILGAAAGAFLYRAVRGQAAETFEGESKSHSLSAERTYKEDITDKFVIETALLELCQIVMFRLLRHNQKGKTVHLKIRYGDFTTVNIQETGQSDVSSVDNLFERVISLFKKKYKAGNGIRLLGVGIQNITDDSNAAQGQLFDFGEKKKQQVEQAILNLQKKDPAVNVKKARLFKKFPIFIICALLCAMRIGVNAQEKSGRIDAESASNLIVIPLPPLPAEDPTTLFDYTIDNNNIEFLAEGFWQMQLEGKTGFIFAENKPAVSTFTPPVFSQKVDLSLWFMLNRSWYFEGAFADGFEKNTVAAGYNGTGVVKSARISNRGIIFPSAYPADTLSRGISGGDNQAPGFSISLSGEKWKSNAAIRYDYLLPREKTWYGRNEVSHTDLSASSWSRGKFFVLPSRESAALIEGVFVESASGSARDSEGRHFRELLPSEYLLIPSQALLVLAKEAVTTDVNSQQRVLLRVAVTFSDNRTRADNDMGTFTAVSVSGGDFLKSTRDFFLSSAANPADVINYAYTYQFLINTRNALMLQSPSGFSPFASGWKYASYASNAGNIRVIAPSTETSLKEYEAAVSSDIASITASDFFNSRLTYIDVFSPNAALNSLLDPAARFPFADSFPLVYLLPQNAFDSKTNDTPVIRIESYSSVSRFSIGTSAVNVRVYKNGALDAGALYDSETGVVALSSPPSEFDRIHITWYEENQAADFGSLAAGIGFSYTASPSLELSTSLTSRWAASPEHKFASSDSPSPGFVTLALGADWQPLPVSGGAANFSASHALKIKNSAGVSFETDNTTGFFRVLGMDDSASSTVYLAESAAHSNNILPLLNSRPGQAPRADPDALLEANKGDFRVTAQKDSGISGSAV
jgi:DNA polymerase-4